MNVLSIGSLIASSIEIDFSSMRMYTNDFISGTLMTLAITLITVVLGCIIGFIATLMRRSKFKGLRWIAKAYTQVIRGTPILLQLYLVLFGLPAIGINTPNFPIPFVQNSRIFIGCIMALSLNSGAYISEIFRSGIDAVDPGQMEAARSLGLSKMQTMRKIILPQAVKIIIPALGNEFIMMIKESSMVSIAGVKDIMYVRTIAGSMTYKVFEPLIIIALIYFFLTSICTMLLGLVERKLNTDD